MHTAQLLVEDLGRGWGQFLGLPLGPSQRNGSYSSGQETMRGFSPLLSASIPMRPCKWVRDLVPHPFCHAASICPTLTGPCFQCRLKSCIQQPSGCGHPSFPSVQLFGEESIHCANLQEVCLKGTQPPLRQRAPGLSTAQIWVRDWALQHGG